MTRQEHMNWCKARALEYLEPGEFYSPVEAVTSMMSDLRKHPDTAASTEGVLALLGLKAAASNDPTEARRYIEGFN